MFTDGFANHLADVSSPQLQAIHDACVANLEHSVKDPVLREKLRPNYRAACKRLIMSENFYDAIQRPNARLVTEAHRADRDSPACEPATARCTSSMCWSWLPDSASIASCDRWR